MFGQRSFCVQKILVLFCTKPVFWRAAFTGRAPATSSRDVDSLWLLVNKNKETKKKKKNVQVSIRQKEADTLSA